MKNGKVVYTAIPLGIKNTREELLFCIIDCQEKLRNKRTQSYWIEGDPPEEKQFTLEDLKNFAKARAQVWKVGVTIKFGNSPSETMEYFPPKKIEQIKPYDPCDENYRRSNHIPPKI